MHRRPDGHARNNPRQAEPWEKKNYAENYPQIVKNGAKGVNDKPVVRLDDAGNQVG